MRINKIKEKWIEKNPLSKRRRKKMREKLRNKDISFICPNCIGGLLFHDLGLKFLSPTVNLMMLQTDFFKFIMNMDYYLSCDLEFYEQDVYDFPCAYLGDINVNFTHYRSSEEARSKWNERKERIIKDNMYIFLEERDGLSKEQIQQLNSLQVRGLVIFTANEYKDIPYAVYIKKYKKDGEVGNILKRSILTGSREYEKYFDFVQWFNNANGGNYDVSSFVRY